jgi:hypothetical protein
VSETKRKIASYVFDLSHQRAHDIIVYTWKKNKEEKQGKMNIEKKK